MSFFPNTRPTPKKFSGYVINWLVGTMTYYYLPSFSKEELASRFSDFFICKVAKIKEALVTSRADIGNYIYALACIPPKLANCCLLSEQDIIKIITKSPTRSCVVDQIPTKLFEAACRHPSFNLNQVGKHISAIQLFSR